MPSPKGLDYKVFACPTRVPVNPPPLSKVLLMTQLNGPSIPGTTTQPVIIGIDWADKAHAVCLIDPLRPKPQHSELSQQPEDIAAWAAELRQKLSLQP